MDVRERYATPGCVILYHFLLGWGCLCLECYDWLSNFKHLIGRYNEYVNPHINLQPAHKPCDFFIGKCPFTSANWTLVKLYLGQKDKYWDNEGVRNTCSKNSSAQHTYTYTYVHQMKSLTWIAWIDSLILVLNRDGQMVQPNKRVVQQFNLPTDTTTMHCGAE